MSRIPASTPNVAASPPLSAQRSSAPQRSRSIWAGRRAALFGWQLLGLGVGAALLWLLQSRLPSDSAWQIFTTTLAWLWCATLLSTVLLDTLVARQPYLHFTAVLLSIAIAFGMLFLGFLATHAVFSRWAALTGIAFALAVHWHAWHRWRTRTSPRLAVVDEALLARLAPANRSPSNASALTNCKWVVLAEGQVPSDVDGVVLPDDASSTYRQAVALRAKLAGTQVYSEAFVRSLLTGRLDIDRADTVFLDDMPASIVYAALKRLFDIAGALMLGVLALPFSLIALAIIRLETPGAALLVQPRIGLRGQVFGMLKLRTMRESPPHVAGCDLMPAVHRITRVGAWLRRSRLDELPQLWNVLRGEMSLIGPRPEWTETAVALESRIPQFAFRYLVRPGITGWAQVHQGHVTEEIESRTKLEYDLYYAGNMSLALDLAICAMTVRTIVTGAGAR